MPSLLEARHRLLHLWASLERNQSSRRIHRWQLDILSIPNYVIRKGRLHGNRHGKTEEQRQHFIAHHLRKRGIKNIFKEFMIASRKIQDFRDSQLKIDRTLKISASRSPIACRPTSFWDTKTIDQSLSAHLDAMHRWNSDQTSANDWQNCTVFTVSLEKSDLHRFLFGSIRNSIRRLHPAHHGGSGTIPGGAHEIHQSQAPLSSWKSGIIERRDPLCGFFTKLPRSYTLQVFLL